MTIRSSQRIATFFDGLELLEPGLVSYTRWRPTAAGAPEEVPGFCAVGRKP
ncbi:MAG: SAM-dependent methyltransferase [Actinomadura sp.]